MRVWKALKKVNQYRIVPRPLFSSLDNLPETFRRATSHRRDTFSIDFRCREKWHVLSAPKVLRTDQNILEGNGRTGAIPVRSLLVWPFHLNRIGNGRSCVRTGPVRQTNTNRSSWPKNNFPRLIQYLIISLFRMIVSWFPFYRQGAFSRAKYTLCTLFCQSNSHNLQGGLNFRTYRCSCRCLLLLRYLKRWTPRNILVDLTFCAWKADYGSTEPP